MQKIKKLLTKNYSSISGSSFENSSQNNNVKGAKVRIFANNKEEND